MRAARAGLFLVVSTAELPLGPSIQLVCVVKMSFTWGNIMARLGNRGSPYS